MAYDKPNYTQTPNLFLDQHLPRIRSLAELKVTLVVLRSTLGWHESEAELHISDLVKLTGLSNRHVIRGVALALERGTVRRRSVKCATGDTFAYEANIVRKGGMTKGHALTNEDVTFSATNGHSLDGSSINVLKKERNVRSYKNSREVRLRIEDVKDPTVIDPDGTLRDGLYDLFPGLPFEKYYQAWWASKFQKGGIARRAGGLASVEQYRVSVEQYFRTCSESPFSGNGNGNGHHPPSVDLCDPDRPSWMAGQRK